MKRFLLILSSVLLSVSSSALFFINYASAASPYDTTIKLTDELLLAGVGPYPDTNFSNDWYSQALEAVENRCNAGTSAACITLTNLQNIITNDGSTAWAVFVNKDTPADYFQIVFTLQNPTSRWINNNEFQGGSNSGTTYRTGYFRLNDSGVETDKGLEYVVSGSASGQYIGLSASFSPQKIFLSNFPVTYPSGYEGQQIPDSFSPPEQQTIYPDYSWSVEKDENGNGILRVQYMENLPHFLTGTSYLVVDKMTEKWAALDSQITSLSYQPAGWADWSVNLGDQPLYFMFRVDHNQQLDNPPWVDDIDYTIGQVYYQIYWDGQKAYLAGTTIGCDGTVCNQFETEEQPINSILGNLSSLLQINLDTGLTNIVIAPIEFIKTLPTKTCSPINAPLPFIGGTLSLPCLKPIYDQYAAPIVLMWQVILTSLVSFSVATKVFAKLRETYNPRQNRIEVTNL